MRLGVFAPQQTGKSSYLVGLYGVLTEKNLLPPSAYALSYAFEDPDVMGNFDLLFERLLNETGKSRFPVKTSELAQFSLIVTHKEKRYRHAIEVLDFPGEAVRGNRPGTTAATRVAAFHDLCDAFIVLLDGRAFTETKGRQTAYMLAAHQIYEQLDKAMRTMANRELTKLGTPVAFCISKLDLLDAEQVRVAAATIRRTFVRIFEADPPSPVLVAGVSLGTNIEDDGEFDPLQLEVPLEFCIAMCAANAVHYNDELETRWAGYRATTKSKVDRRTAMGFFERFFDRLETGRSLKSYSEELESDTKRRNEYARKTNEFRSLAEEALKS